MLTTVKCKANTRITVKWLTYELNIGIGRIKGEKLHSVSEFQHLKRKIGKIGYTIIEL